LGTTSSENLIYAAEAMPEAKNHDDISIPRLLPRSTCIPNFLLDNVMPLLSPSAWKVFCFVWRKTIGWNKRRDHLSLSQISMGTGLSRDSAVRALAPDGELSGIITHSGRTGYRGMNAYEAVLDFDEGAVTSRLKRLVAKNDWSLTATPLVAGIDTQNTTTQKQQEPPFPPKGGPSRKKPVTEKPGPEPSAGGQRLAARLQRLILGNNGRARITPGQVRSWGFVADRMLRVDGRTEAEIEAVIDFSQRDQFWVSNIPSMGALRKQFDRLVLKTGRQQKGSTASPKDGTGIFRRIGEPAHEV
jgi:hypothetical protein